MGFRMYAIAGGHVVLDKQSLDFGWAIILLDSQLSSDLLHLLQLGATLSLPYLLPFHHFLFVFWIQPLRQPKITGFYLGSSCLELSSWDSPQLQILINIQSFSCSPHDPEPNLLSTPLFRRIPQALASTLAGVGAGECEVRMILIWLRVYLWNPLAKSHGPLGVTIKHRVSHDHGVGQVLTRDKVPRIL